MNRVYNIYIGFLIPFFSPGAGIPSLEGSFIVWKLEPSRRSGWNAVTLLSSVFLSLG